MSDPVVPPGASVPADSDRAGPLAAFREPGFRLFWGGALISNIGSWMQNVAQGWLVLELTDSAFMLGFVGFASTIPMLILLLLGGVFADRVDRRRLLLVTMTGMMVFAAALAVLTWQGVVTIWHILVLSFLSGCGIALAAPAYQAFVHDLVGNRHLQNAIALNSAQFNLSRVVGPSLAGLAVVPIGLAGCFGLNAASFLAAIVALFLIRIKPRPAFAGPPVWQSLIEGVTYVRQHPRVRILLLMTTLVSILAMPYATLLPIIARDVLGQDASGLGYLYAIGGLGAVAGALSLAVRNLFRQRGEFLLAMVTTTGFATSALGLANTLVVAVIALVMISFAATASIALMNTLLQELVDDEMRGRVLSMYGLAFMGTFPIGNLLAGTIARYSSASATLAVTGAILAASGVYIAATRRRVRAIA